MFKRNTNREEVKDFEGGNGKFLNKSGIYTDVTVKALIYDEAENGGAVVNLFVESQGEEQVIYGDIRVYNKGGKDNKIGQDRLNELLVVTDIEDLGDPVEVELPIGKKKAMKTVAVFENFEDQVADIRITNQYSVWNNNIQEKTVVSKFYRAGDHATAAEVLALEEGEEVEAGAKFTKDQEFADNVKYLDGTDEHNIGLWIKAKRPKGTGGSINAGGATKKPSFAKPKKKFGSK